MEAIVQFFQRDEVGRDVFANGGVRAATRFHGIDPLGRQCLVADQELRVFACEDVIGHYGQRKSISQFPAECQHERGFPAAHRTADSDRERAPAKIPRSRRHRPLVKSARIVRRCVRVAMAVMMVVTVRVIVPSVVFAGEVVVGIVTRFHGSGSPGDADLLEGLTLEEPRIESILACLKDLRQRCRQRHAWRIEIPAAGGQGIHKRAKAMAKSLPLQRADNAQAYAAGNQASQGNIQKQAGGLINVNFQRCGDGAEHDGKMPVHALHVNFIAHLATGGQVERRDRGKQKGLPLRPAGPIGHVVANERLADLVHRHGLRGAFPGRSQRRYQGMGRLRELNVQKILQAAHLVDLAPLAGSFQPA